MPDLDHDIDVTQTAREWITLHLIPAHDTLDYKIAEYVATAPALAVIGLLRLFVTAVGDSFVDLAEWSNHVIEALNDDEEDTDD